jgi:hypothetical protein
MTLLPPVGTPDNQHGVASPQILLATVSALTAAATVTLPPNAESVVIFGPGFNSPASYVVQGVQSGNYYTPNVMFVRQSGQWWDMVMVNCSPTIDRQLTITVTPTPTAIWYVYADQASHISFDPQLAQVIQAIGDTLNNHGIVALGSNGGTTPALAVDSFGHLLTFDQQLLAAMAQSGTDIPADAVQVGGSDGTYLYTIKVDSAGEIIPIVPTGTTNAVVGTVAFTQLLAALSSGNYYLFGVDFRNDTAAGVAMGITNSGGAYISTVRVPAGDTRSVDLSGFKYAGVVNQISSVAANTFVTLRYAVGP